MIKEKIILSLEKALAELKFGEISIVLEYPIQEIHGDYATNVAMVLGKKLSKNPMEIATKIVNKLPKIKGMAKVKIAKPGFINFFVDVNWLAKKTLKQILKEKENYGNSKVEKKQKIIVEHTSVNPNKAMHVGNLRNAILGDTIVRILKKQGYTVEVQNYIDDTGAQVADTVTAILYLQRKKLKNQPFDEFCWDIYAKINQCYETMPELVEKKKEVTKKIEEGNNKIAKKAKEISNKVLQCHLEQMAKFNIFYDLLVKESDILKEGFWEKAFLKLKKSPQFVYKKKGKLAKSWVLKYKSEAAGDKVFVRSNGTTVYSAKDTAYHLWKFGLLGKDFHYSKWPKKINAHTPWATDFRRGKEKKGFAKADKIINIIDLRQSYSQEMVRLALKNLSFKKQAENYHHLAYGVVYLSPETAKKIGIDISEQKGFYAMAGRKGIGVKVSDLLNLLLKKIKKEKGAKKIAGAKTGKKASSLDIAVGALRHYMLKFTPPADITFDYKEALKLYGNTGPYLQYSHARCAGILSKAGKVKLGVKEVSKLNLSEIKLIKFLSQWPEVLEQSAKNLSPSMVSDYAFKLSTNFHTFYEESPVLKAESEFKDFRLSLVAGYKEVMENVLNTLGMMAPDRM